MGTGSDYIFIETDNKLLSIPLNKADGTLGTATDALDGNMHQVNSSSGSENAP